MNLNVTGNTHVARLALLLTILLFANVLSVSSSSHLSQIIPASGSIGYLPHVEVTVDSSTVLALNNFSLGFQLDGRDIRQWRDRSVLRELAQDADFKLVRFFEHRLGKPCIYWNEETKTGTWDWADVNLLIQRIFEIGAEPLIVLGFYSWTLDRISSAPTGMSNNPETGLPYPDQWGPYCAEWIKHFKAAGLSVKYYEIINEAFHYFGWYAEQPKLGYYMDLYNAAAIAMRAANPNVQIGCDESNKKAVLNYFISDGEDLDFISFHRYGVSTLSASDEEVLNAAETKYLFETTNKYAPEQAVEIYKNAKGANLPIIMSEGNMNSAYTGGTDPRTRTMFGAVYTALSIRMFTLMNFRHSIYFTFGSSGTEGIGMVNVYDNEPWYPYYAQQMIGNNLAVGDTIVDSTSSSDDVRSLAWIHDGALNILLICKVDEARTVYLRGVEGQLDYLKIDNTISWENPNVQTGVIGSMDSLTIEGYTVALLQTRIP